MKKMMRRLGIGTAWVLAPFALATLAGCHSHYIQANVENNSGAPISLLEVDYPSASFGTDSLANGAVFHYRFKILGSGPTKVLWTDAQHHDHSASGPSLRSGQQGTLTITITSGTATWQKNLTSK